MDSNWNIITNVASICSIVGLPIAIWQIFKVKLGAKVTGNAVHKFLVLETSSTLNKIYDTITIQQDSIQKIKSMSVTRGISNNKIIEECNNVINSINLCIYNLPSEYVDISQLMQNGVNSISNYIKVREDNQLKEASGYLYAVINCLKKSKENYLSEQVDILNK